VPVAPLIGGRPPLSVQQLPETAPTARDTSVQAQTEPTVVSPVFAPPELPPAFAAGPTGAPRATGVVPTSSTSVAAAVPIQRLTAAPVSPSSTGRGAGPGASSGLHGHGHGPGPGPRPSVGDLAVAAGLGTWSADGSVVFDPPPGEAPAVGASEAEAVVQRRADGTASFAGPESGPVPTTVTVLAPEPTVQLAAAGGAAGAGGGGGSETELDELAKRLYGRMRQQLRRELILDRERSGSLIEMPR
jgi:hypothetical protein